MSKEKITYRFRPCGQLSQLRGLVQRIWVVGPFFVMENLFLQTRLAIGCYEAGFGDLGLKVEYLS